MGTTAARASNSPETQLTLELHDEMSQKIAELLHMNNLVFTRELEEKLQDLANKTQATLDSCHKHYQYQLNELDASILERKRPHEASEAAPEQHHDDKLCRLEDKLKSLNSQFDTHFECLNNIGLKVISWSERMNQMQQEVQKFGKIAKDQKHRLEVHAQTLADDLNKKIEKPRHKRMTSEKEHGKNLCVIAEGDLPVCLSSVCLCVCLCVCRYTCMLHLCLSVFLYVHVCVCVCLLVYICKFFCIFTSTHVCFNLAICLFVFLFVSSKIYYTAVLDTVPVHEISVIGTTAIRNVTL